MGLFSGIKKVGSKIWGGIKKVFKKVAKALNTKWGKAIMIGVSLVTAGGGLAAMGSAFSQAGVKGVAAQLAQGAVNVIKAPIDMVAKGISGAGNALGAESLANFGKTLSDGLNAAGNTVVSGVDNILGVTRDAAGNVAGLAGEASSVVDASKSSTLDGTVGGEEIAGADNATKAVESVDATGGIEGANPQELGGQGGQVGGDVAQATRDATQAGLQAPAEGPQKGYFARAVDWMEKNPELTKMGGKMLMNAMTEPPKSEMEKMNEFYMEHGMGKGDFNFDPSVSSAGQQALGDENARIRDRADQSFSRYQPSAPAPTVRRPGAYA